MSDLYYMGRPVELVKQPDVIDNFKAIASAAPDEVARANVFMALWSFWNFEHAFDDIVDSGKLSRDHCEKLFKQCADYVHAALFTPEQPDAVVWFKAAYIEGLELAEFNDADAKLAMKAFDDFTGNLLTNPFYLKHAARHLAMFDMIILRAIAGDEMAASNKAEVRALAPAVRCGDIDFMIHCALLAGGYDHARKFTSTRDYDVPD